MTDADKLAIQEASRPSWKKVLLWIGVALLILTAITVVLVMVFRKKPNPAAAVKEVINQAKKSNMQADVEAKIEVAKARAVEDTVVKELERIKDIDDAEEQAKRLADLF